MSTEQSDLGVTLAILVAAVALAAGILGLSAAFI